MDDEDESLVLFPALLLLLVAPVLAGKEDELENKRSAFENELAIEQIKKEPQRYSKQGSSEEKLIPQDDALRKRCIPEG